ncbi:MAG: hypothetical protein HRT71_15370 [Flavobacteriales bacterium]|nr:hypothetical protein [Flavobacteriales bacterium]
MPDRRTLLEKLTSVRIQSFFICKIISSTKPTEDKHLPAPNPEGLPHVGGTVVFGKRGHSKAIIIELLHGNKQLSEVEFNNYYPVDSLYFVQYGDFIVKWNPKTPNYDIEIIKKYADIQRGTKSGNYKFYYQDSTLMASGKFKKGKPHGTWLHYSSGGKLKSSCEIKKGKWHGEHKEYHSNGVLKTLIEFKENVQSGIFNYYDKNGNLLE